MTVDYDVRSDGIAIVTMNRPEKMNALTLADKRRLAECFADLRNNPNVLVGIITGAGTRAFTAGADMSEDAGGPEAQGELREAGDGYLMLNMVPYLKGINIWKPLIAAVNGHAIAQGACIVVGTDIRIASTNATFALNEPLFGSLADGGAIARLVRQIPYAYAMDLLLTGRRIDARQMKEYGIVNEVVAPERLMPRALEIAEHLVTKCNKWSVQLTKQSAIRGLDMGLSQALVEEVLYEEVLVNRSATASERMASLKKNLGAIASSMRMDRSGQGPE